MSNQKLRDAAQAVVRCAELHGDVVYKMVFNDKVGALRAALAEPEDDAEALRNELAHAGDEIGKLVSMRVEDDKTFADLRAEVERLREQLRHSSGPPKIAQVVRRCFSPPMDFHEQFTIEQTPAGLRIVLLPPEKQDPLRRAQSHGHDHFDYCDCMGTLIAPCSCGSDSLTDDIDDELAK